MSREFEPLIKAIQNVKMWKGRESQREVKPSVKNLKRCGQTTKCSLRRTVDSSFMKLVAYGKSTTLSPTWRCGNSASTRASLQMHASPTHSHIMFTHLRARKPNGCEVVTSHREHTYASDIHAGFREKIVLILSKGTNVRSVGAPLGSGFSTSSVTSARRRLASDRRVAVAI